MLEGVKSRIRDKLYQPVNGLAQMTVIAIVLGLVAIFLAIAHAH